MSLEGYKPLDFSSIGIDPSALASLSSPVDNHTIAQTILSNTGWDQANTDLLKPSKKKTLVSRLMDLLSTGNYAIAEGFDRALGAHEADSNDSVISDIFKSLKAYPGGVQAGGTAGLKGAFGTNDVANDPTDKTHWADVILGHTDNGKRALDPYSGMSDADRKKIMRGAAMSGLGLDIVADPLTYVGLGAVPKIKRAAELPKVLEEAGDLSKVNDVLQGEKNVPELANLDKAPVGSGLSPVDAKAPVIPNNLEDTKLTAITNPTWYKNELPAGDEVLNTPPKSLETLDPKIASRLEDPARRAKIAGTVLKDVINKGENWNDLVKTKLAKTFPGLSLEHTNAYLDQMATHGVMLSGALSKNARGRKAFTEALGRTLEADFRKARPVEAPKIPDLNVGQPIRAREIVDALAQGNKAADELAAPVEKITEGSILTGEDAAIVLDTARKYRKQVETGLFTGMKNPEQVKEALSTGKMVKWTGPKQVNMWQTILKRLPYSGPAKYRKALSILRAVEDNFIAAGHKPFSAARATESVELRLSDVIEKIGSAKFAKNPEFTTTLLRSALAGGEMSAAAKKAAKAAPDLKNEIDQIVEGAKAGGVVQEASAVKQGVDAGSKAALIAENSTGGAARTEEAITIAAKSADDIAKMSGAVTNNASQIVKTMFLKSDPVESAITASKINTKAALSTGKLGKFNNVFPVTKAIARTAELPLPRTFANIPSSNARVLDWLGARFNTAYKNGDMRPVYLQEAATARSSVAKRAHVWNDTVRQFGRDPELWNRAYQSAQGSYVAPLGSPEAELSKFILQNMENLFGSSGLKAGAALENSVAGRAQLLMSELNENLKRYGIKNEFTKSKIKDPLGVEHDFTQGTDWLNSWQTWKVEQPVEFMMRVQNAVENTVRESSMFAEISSRWGTTQRARGYTATVDHPRLAGVKFTPEMAEQAKTFIKNLDEIKKPNSKQMQMFDHILSKWKASVTIYMPSHHIRNVIGDAYFNWLAGVNDIRSYSKAIKVMSSQRGRYDSIENVGNLTSAKSVEEAMKRATMGTPVEKGTNILLTMKNGHKITNDMIYTSAFQRGLLPNAKVLEDIPDDAMLLDKFQPFGGKVQAKAHDISEYREHFIRLAHYINEIKNSSKSFAQATEDAASAVRKWHPDGMDLTSFERNGMRRVFPFYSWTRKAIPLVVESLLMKPGKVSMYPKIQGGLQGMIQGQQVDWADPFPEDQLFPDWIREKGIGPLTGSTGSYGIINPSTPTLDITAMASDPLKGIGQMLNPAARIPAELMTNTDASTGAPITNYGDYATKQIPGISTVGRVTNIGLGGPTTKYATEGFNENALVNLLTGLGKLNTGPYQTQAQFDLADYLKNRRQ